MDGTEVAPSWTMASSQVLTQTWTTALTSECLYNMGTLHSVEGQSEAGPWVAVLVTFLLTVTAYLAQITLGMKGLFGLMV